jgi:hypothetical protein
MAKPLLLIFGLLILINSCSSPVSNSAVPAVSENRKIVIPPIKGGENDDFGKDCHKWFETEFAVILTKNTSPAFITNVVSADGKKDLKEGVDVEIKNVSDKTISSVFIEIDSNPHCLDDMYVATLSDAFDEFKAVINPGETAVKHYPAQEAKNAFRLKKCREPMANRSKKVLIEIGGVKFSDGATWSAGNNCLEDTVSPPNSVDQR